MISVTEVTRLGAVRKLGARKGLRAVRMLGAGDGWVH